MHIQHQCVVFFFLMIRRPPRSTLFPYTTLFRSFMNPSFADMTTPALVIAGDHDQSTLSVRGPDWFADPYFLSPGGKSLLTDRKSTRLNSSHANISYAVFCLKKKKIR